MQLPIQEIAKDFWESGLLAATASCILNLDTISYQMHLSNNLTLNYIETGTTKEWEFIHADGFSTVFTCKSSLFLHLLTVMSEICIEYNVCFVFINIKVVLSCNLEVYCNYFM